MARFNFLVFIWHNTEQNDENKFDFHRANLVT